MGLMKNFFYKRKSLFLETGLQDIVFLGGIFIIFSILIIGFFPDKDWEFRLNQELFIYAVMTVPTIAAVYFIFVSFRRNLYSDSAVIGSSIKKKMSMAFIFVALLPSLPVVLTSNYLINKALSNLKFDKARSALSEAVQGYGDSIDLLKTSVSGGLDAIENFSDRGMVRPGSAAGRRAIRELCGSFESSAVFFRMPDFLPLDSIAGTGGSGDIETGLRDFYLNARVQSGKRMIQLSIGNSEILAGSVVSDGICSVVYRVIPVLIKKREKMFINSFNDYERLEYQTVFVKSRIGIFLMVLTSSLLIISMLLSSYMSENITRPVLELTRSANEVASGNFNIHLERNSEDELALLFRTFNKMTGELEQNRKMMYQKQKLEAWRDMARRLVHEIKNPLTPIRLSAERIRRRFIENQGDIENVVLTGTETIIDEVQTLMNILGEFTKFARLPEMNPEKINVNSLLENCVNSFSGNESIIFRTDLNPVIPDVFLDKTLIKQAIINLIQNSRDALGDTGEIIVSSDLVENDVGIIRISIQDNGPGISDENIDRVFTPGFSTKPGGTGLGLAIVEKIIMEHRGKIYCRSLPGKGAAFIIEMKLSEIDGPYNGEDPHS